MTHAALLLLATLASAPKAAATPAPAPLVTLDRRGCGATCPAYTLKVWADGRVEFEGRHRVAAQGKQEAKLSAEQVEALRRAFAEAGFTRLKGSFTRADTTDMETVVLSYAPRGKARKVTHNLGDASAPKALEQLERRVDEIVGTDRWVKVGAAEER